MDGVALRRSIDRCLEDASSRFSVCVIVLQDGVPMTVQIGRMDSSDSMWEASARGHEVTRSVYFGFHLSPDRYVVVFALGFESSPSE